MRSSGASRMPPSTGSRRSAAASSSSAASAGTTGARETSCSEHGRPGSGAARSSARDVRLGADRSDPDIKRVSDEFGLGARKTPFGNAGLMRIGPTDSGRSRLDDGGRACLRRPPPGPRGRPRGDRGRPGAVLRRRRRPREVAVPQGRQEPDADQPFHRPRIHLRRGADPVPRPHRPASRTILTGEGGATPSRFKHLIQTEDGRYRRLTPRELERLNGFPGDWTAGMSDGKRAFMMGNALVVGLVERVAARARSSDVAVPTAPAERAAAS